MSTVTHRLGVPLALAAATALIGTAGSAFAANHAKLSVSGTVSFVAHQKGRVRIDGRLFTVVPRVAHQLALLGNHARVTVRLNDHDQIIGLMSADHHQNRQTGTVTAVTASTITLGSRAYTLAPGAVVHYRHFMLSVTQVPLKSTATIALNHNGEVTAVWLHQDANLPPRSTFQGMISGVTSNSLTIDGHTLPVSSSVSVKMGDHTVAFSQVAANQRARVRLNSLGHVVQIRLLNLPSVKGTITADTASSLTIGGKTYAYAANAHIRYHKYQLTESQVPVGSSATVRLNALDQASLVILRSDANLPQQKQVSGTVAATSSSTITIGSYTLPLASSLNVSYYGVNSLTNSVATGEQARASLNNQGQVAQLAVGTSLSLNGGLHKPQK